VLWQLRGCLKPFQEFLFCQALDPTASQVLDAPDSLFHQNARDSIWIDFPRFTGHGSGLGEVGVHPLGVLLMQIVLRTVRHHGQYTLLGTAWLYSLWNIFPLSYCGARNRVRPEAEIQHTLSTIAPAQEVPLPALWLLQFIGWRFLVQNENGRRGERGKCLRICSRWRISKARWFSVRHRSSRNLE